MWYARKVDQTRGQTSGRGNPGTGTCNTQSMGNGDGSEVAQDGTLDAEVRALKDKLNQVYEILGSCMEANAYLEADVAALTSVHTSIAKYKADASAQRVEDLNLMHQHRKDDMMWVQAVNTETWNWVKEARSKDMEFVQARVDKLHARCATCANVNVFLAIATTAALLWSASVSR